ncbi:hypothetical protein A2335_01970 [Candidatus Peregrinibacteria bacterium RIFOXYB2_FULL_32_7]|nr:MAG: hypothetical protein A2335_01970 [Candidatus Peregrinibacteria bacterium RIFOXYB2_FULL_32_7]
MKNKLILISILILLFCTSLIYYFLFKNFESKTINETMAIETVKNKFPELKDYPSHTLPSILKTKWFSVKARKEGAFSYR